MSTPRVSVLMVTADSHAPYIVQAVNSVVAQSDRDWELVIVDDGPQGLAGAALGSVADERIHYIPQQHRGIERLGDTYNAALVRSSGRLIAILEGDDYWPIDKLQYQAAMLENSPAVLSYGVVQHVTADGNELDQAPAPQVRRELDALHNDPIGRTAISMARHWQFVSPASIMMRRSALDALGGFLQPPYYYAVDFPTVLALATTGPFLFHDRVLGFGRHHARSATASVVPGSRYLMGMFRCWSETMVTSPIRPTRIDVESIVAHWKPRLAGHYRLLGREALKQGNKRAARQMYRLSAMRSGFRNALLGVAGFAASLPLAPSQALEAAYNTLWGASIDNETLKAASAEARDIVDSFETLQEVRK